MESFTHFCNLVPNNYSIENHILRFKKMIYETTMNKQYSQMSDMIIFMGVTSNTFKN